jgi:hypothetical protein
MSVPEVQGVGVGDGFPVGKKVGSVVLVGYKVGWNEMVG